MITTTGTYSWSFATQILRRRCRSGAIAIALFPYMIKTVTNYGTHWTDWKIDVLDNMIDSHVRYL